jgi:hypothetical protein
MDKTQLILDGLNKVAGIGTYREYLSLYQRGEKEKAKKHMLKFIQELKMLPTIERRVFIDKANQAAFLSNQYSMYLPINLYNEVVLPEIDNWVIEEPNNPIPNRWSKNLEDIKKAVVVSPKDQIALENFASRVVGKISMNQHELESGHTYDGDPKDDFSQIIFLEKVIVNIVDVEKKEQYQKILFELKKTALSCL